MAKAIKEQPAVDMRERHRQLLKRLEQHYEQLEQRLTEIEAKLPDDDQQSRLPRKPR